MSDRQNGSARAPSRLERAGVLAARAATLNPSDPILRRALIVGITLIVALSAAMVAVAALNRFPDIDWRLEPGWVAVAVASLTVFLFAHAELWRRLLSAIGYELPVRTAYAIWSTSTLCRYVPTSLLLPVVRAAMTEREGVPKRVCLASVVYELALATTGALLVSGYFLVELPQLEGHPERFAALVVPAIALIALQPEIFHRVADVVLKRLGRQPLPLSLGRWRVLEFAALFALSYVIGGVCIYALAETINPVGGSEIPTAIAAFSVATSLSVVAFVIPAGLIAREAGLAVALAPLMATAPAVAIAVIARILQLIVEILMTVITRLIARNEKQKLPAQDPIEDGV